jgi:hypothetical protein
MLHKDVRMPRAQDAQERPPLLHFWTGIAVRGLRAQNPVIAPTRDPP